MSRVLCREARGQRPLGQSPKCQYMDSLGYKGSSPISCCLFYIWKKLVVVDIERTVVHTNIGKCPCMFRLTNLLWACQDVGGGESWMRFCWMCEKIIWCNVSEWWQRSICPKNLHVRFRQVSRKVSKRQPCCSRVMVNIRSFVYDLSM